MQRMYAAWSRAIPSSRGGFIAPFRLDPFRCRAAFLLFPEWRARFQIVDEKFRRLEGCRAVSTRDGDQNDVLAWNKPSGAMNDGDAEKRPSAFGLVSMTRNLALRHAGIVFERERRQTILAAY